MAEVVADATREALIADELVGTVVNGRFHIVKRIARGGMANVYFATQAPLGRAVAVKVLHGVRNVDAESEESFRGRFLREASMLAKLQHPNIVMLLDYGQINDVPGEHYFMAMEYLRGQTLAQRFRARGRLKIEECIALGRQVGRGLREAHRHGFIHRDLKPSNIMLVPEDDNNDIIKLVDFGVGKIMPERAGLVEEGEDVTRAGLLLGSPRYMSPEQIRCEPVEFRTDLYALGVILFQALTGRLPFDARTEFDVMMAHCLTPAPTLDEVTPDQYFPESLAQLVSSLLQKQVTSRPTIDEFLQRLAGVEEEVFGSVSLAGPTLQGSSLSTPPSRRERTSTSDISREFRGPPSWTQRLDSGSAVQTNQTAQTATMPPLPPVAVEEPAPRRRNAAVLVIALLSVLLVGVLFARSFLPSLRVGITEKTPASARAPANTESGVVSGAASGGVAANPPMAFDLAIDSEPSSAIVTENGIIVGVTPIKTRIERASVAARARYFLVKHEGYYSYTLEQGDSAADVRASVVLEAITASSEAARSRPARPNAPAAPHEPIEEPPPVKRSEGSNGLDIRLRR